MKVMGQRSIIALRVVKEAIRLYGLVPQIPMTKEVVDAVKRMFECTNPETEADHVCSPFGK